MTKPDFSYTPSLWQRRWFQLCFGVGFVVVSGVSGLSMYVQQQTMSYHRFDSKKAHHRKDHFVNPWATAKPPQPWQLMWEFLTSKVDQSKHPAPSVPQAYKDRQYHLTPNTLTWIGHASFQLRLAQANILTDPVFGKRTSPFSFAGPARFQPPGIDREKLGKVDVIVFSHNHYDHLDRETLESLPHREQIDIIAPLGFKRGLQKMGYRKIHELDWWESRTVRGIQFVCLPVQHFSGRGLNDRNRTLWAGWAILTPQFRVFFAGDTGYYDGFKQIGKRFGPFDLAMMPIGAYEPRRFFKPIHMDPEEAIQAALDIRAKRVVPMHWGTFPLSLEPPLDPPRRFLKAAQKARYSEQDAFVMRVGETRLLPLRTR